MVQGELLHKSNRVAWVIGCLILIQTKAPQNNKILSLEKLFHGSVF